MDEIVTERSGSILRVALNRPTEKNAMTSRKRLMKQPFREQIKGAMEAENQEFSARVRSEEARQAFAAFLEKRRLPAEAPR